MAIVPETLEQIIRTFGRALEAWYSSQVYVKLVARNAKHILVRLNDLIDFGPLEVGCASYYHSSGPGAKPTHTVQRLVRTQLVRCLYNWSLRETEEQLDNNLLLRWFVGYGILEPVPDHSTLDRFEQWVCSEQHRLYFDTILQQIEAAFPEVRAGAQVGDTYACQANAAMEGLIGVLRHTSRLIMQSLAEGAPHLHTVLLAQLDQPQLFGVVNERNGYYLSEAEQQQRKDCTVRGAWQLLQLLEPHLESLAKPLKTEVSERVADLRKIIADEYSYQVDEHNQLQALVERDAKHKGGYRVASATDREATYRKHGEDLALGYNVSLAAHAETGFICEIQAATGAEPDQAGVARLVEEQREQRGLCPKKVIYDQAAGAGRTRAEVDRVSFGQTQLVAGIPPLSVSGRYTPEDFKFDGNETLFCPAGRSTTCRYRAGKQDAWQYEFSAKTCRDCPLWSHCHEDGARLTGPRRVFISDYQEQIRQARLYNHSADFKADMRLRPRVERFIFMLTHYDGARRARSCGLMAVDFQAKMCATVRNLRTWILLLDQRAHVDHLA
jgi:IS5 family transposase